MPRKQTTLDYQSGRVVCVCNIEFVKSGANLKSGGGGDAFPHPIESWCPHLLPPPKQFFFSCFLGKKKTCVIVSSSLTATGVVTGSASANGRLSARTPSVTSAQHTAVRLDAAAASMVNRIGESPSIHTLVKHVLRPHDIHQHLVLDTSISVLFSFLLLLLFLPLLHLHFLDIVYSP